MLSKIYTGIGSRQTPHEICKEMTTIARFFSSLGWTLRSGGANGADSAFEAGAGDKKEIFLPYKNFNNNPSPFFKITKEALELAGKHHPGWHNCDWRARNFHARNCYQVLGYDLKTPTRFVLCWTPPGAVGGTGQAIRVAQAHNIPVFNMNDQDWKKKFRDSKILNE